MKKILLAILLTNFISTTLFAEAFENADDICYIKDQISTKGAGCVDFGPFAGGFACTQTIPLRNLSNDDLSEVDILWDIDDGFQANFIESCGIDGENELELGGGGDCNYKALIEFGPFTGFEHSILFDMPIFTASGDTTNHSIYRFNLMGVDVDPFALFRDGALQATYTKNGDIYSGTIKECERKWEKVKHLCYDYDSITYDNPYGLGMCMDFGPFQGGFNCKQTIPIRSLTDQNVTDIDIVLDQHGMNGSMLDSCGIDGAREKGEKCHDNTRINFGPMGMMSRGFVFDMPNYDEPFDKHTIYTRSMMSMEMDPIAFFTGENMYTRYSINEDVKYEGYIPACIVNKDPVPDLCYVDEAITYDGVACVDFGPFQGGAGCKQTIPIRSSSKTPLTKVDILLEEHGLNGEFLGDCGVDGHTGFFDQSCKRQAAFDMGPMAMFGQGVLFDPMATYAPLAEHSIYTSAAMEMGVSLFRGDNLYTHYVKDGNLTSGRIPACKRNYADDLCWENPDTSGFCSIFISGACTLMADIKNQRSYELTSVSTIHEVDFSFAKSFSACGIDEKTGNCETLEAIDFLFSGFGGSGTIFKPMPDYSPGHKHTIFEYIGLGLFQNPGNTFYGTFLKNEEWFSSKLAKCLPASQLAVITGKFDAWDYYRTGISGDRHIGTKIVNKPFTLSIASINNAGDAYEAKNISADIAYGLVTPDGTDFIVQAEKPFDTTGNTLIMQEFTVPDAYKELNVGFKLCSDIIDGNLILRDSDQCAAAEVLACDETRPDAVAHWRMCTNEDSFSVRPDHFAFKLQYPHKKETLRSGVKYKYEITAKDYLNNPSSGYDQTGSNLDDDNATILFSDASENNGTLNGTPYYSGSSYDFEDGISKSGADTYVADISFDDVGTLAILLKDDDWASIDSDDTPESCGTGLLYGIAVPGRFICGETRPTFIPHHFALKSVSLHNHDNGPITYLSKDEDPGDVNNDITMSAHIQMTIVAENESGGTTQNFRKGDSYYENPLSVAFNLLAPLTVAGVDMVPYQHDMDKVRAFVTPSLLGFGTTGTPGEYTMRWDTITAAQKLNFNFNKDFNKPLQPFTVNMTDLNVSVTSAYGSETIKGESADAPGELGGDATFQYLKVAATQKLYDDVSTDTAITPIRALVYCPLSYTACAALNIDTSNGRTPDEKWWLSTSHDSTKGYGTIVFAEPVNGDIIPNTVPITSGGINNTVKVKNTSGSVPQTVNADLDPVATDSWVLTPDADHDSHFIGTSGWAGKGKTGYIIDSEASSKKNKRIGW